MITRPPACQLGPNACHGPAAWCDDCGDVGATCPHHPRCDAHHCPTCGNLALIRDGECDDCRSRAAYRFGPEHERRERALVRALEIGDHPRHVARAARAARLAFALACALLASCVSAADYRRFAGALGTEWRAEFTTTCGGDVSVERARTCQQTNDDARAWLDAAWQEREDALAPGCALTAEILPVAPPEVCAVTSD